MRDHSDSIKQNNWIILMPSGRREQLPQGTSLLDAARQMGVEIESICGGKLTCGKCKVKIETGQFAKHGITSAVSHVTPPTEKEQALLQRMRSEDFRLACQCFVEGDVLAFVPEEARAHKQIIRKSATERVIDVEPAVRKVYVEVEKPALGEHRGDWGRLRDALVSDWQLDHLTIDWMLLRRLQPILRRGDWGVTVTVWQDREVIDVQPGFVEGLYGLAVDIGSTTIAGHLCDLRTGEVVATESMMNPQITYGEDLMSRVSFAMTDAQGLDKMHKAVLKALNTLTGRAVAAAGLKISDIVDVVLVGNTTMTHILLGVNPQELGGAPFALATRDGLNIKARELGMRIHSGAYVFVMPSEAGHVGGDNVAALIAEAPHNQDEQVLLVDVGTNAELVLGNRERLFSASSPTGPAFEGAQIAYGMRAAPGAIERVRIDPETKAAIFKVIGEERWSHEWGAAEFEKPAYLASGICGSGIIEAIAEMFLCGILASDGRFTELQHPRLIVDGRRKKYILATGVETATGEPIFVTQDDVRAIQLAKAALYAGAKLLMRQAKIEQVDRIVLAGAFGSYIDTKYAMVLGLIPNCDLKNVYAVGNAAGDGARIALIDATKRDQAQYLAEWVTYIETAVDPNFQDEFVGAIAIPHATDSFPELKDILPLSAGMNVGEARANGSGRSRRRTRRKNRR
ncbi:MAG: ASKHA domain-containing protein [Ardenticatenaceae bacterium]|nr:ASKHA domain-containing protein [Ardenticatenaceae bacterium]